jgi:phosphatidylserine decarboxylase
MVPVVVAAALTVVTAALLARKWELGVPRAAAFSLVVACLVGAALWFAGIDAAATVVSTWIISLALCAACVAYRFYRDPERHTPAGDHLVSPADGVVVYVRRAHAGRIPVSEKRGRAYTLAELAKTSLESADAHVIGISMSFLDVHVNRAPMSGRVTVQRHFSGTFGSLRRPESVLANERMTTVVERDGLQVVIVQIASRLVRQIVSYVRAGQFVRAGQRIGMIRFGSQVDVVVPDVDGVDVVVQQGQRLTAGVSVLATFGDTR